MTDPDRRHPAQRRRPARHGRDRRRSRCWRWRRSGCFRRAEPADGSPAEPEGRGARAGRAVAAPARAPALAVARRGGSRLLLLLPHLTLLLVSFVPVGTWTTEPLPAGVHLRNYADAGAGSGARCGRCSTASGWRPSRPSAAVAIALAAGVAGGAAPGARRARRSRRCSRCPGRCRAPCSPSRSPRRSACTRRWAGRVRPGRHALDPSARLSRAEPADHQPRDPRRLPRSSIPSLDEAAATLGRRPAGGPCAGSRCRCSGRRSLAGASLAFVTAFGDFVTSIMLYTYDTRPISLEILVEPAPGRRRRGGGLRRRADAGERRGVRARRRRGGAPDDARRRTATARSSAGSRC